MFPRDASKVHLLESVESWKGVETFSSTSLPRFPIWIHFRPPLEAWNGQAILDKSGSAADVVSAHDRRGDRGRGIEDGQLARDDLPQDSEGGHGVGDHDPLQHGIGQHRRCTGIRACDEARHRHDPARAGERGERVMAPEGETATELATKARDMAED